MRALLPSLLVATCAALQAQAPEVVSRSPAHLAEVDAKKTTKLVVTFDRDMQKSGFSICGGGPLFPTIKARPQWKDARTLVVEVELEPDHEYRLSLNCPAARNFRSVKGVALAPVPWSFSTLPADLRPAKQQSKRNRRALKVLMRALAERYSYYELRVQDWRKLEARHRDAVLAARTDRGFAAAAARMLQPTEDLHLYLRCGGRTFGAGSRAIDPLYRRQLLPKYVDVQPAGPHALAGRTDDRIGYLSIASWTSEIDVERIAGAITELADTKALIVDVRANAGGDEGRAREIAAWFVDGTKTYAKNRYRERAGKNGFGKLLERKITGHGEQRSYGKPVVLLTSRYVMSSNEAFVLMMRQARDCVVVGQATFGSSGNPKPIELGNGVTAFVPSWQAMRPDGSVFEGEGIEPDEFVPCNADDLKTRDPILEKALLLLRARVGE